MPPSEPEDWIRPAPDGVILRVHLAPRARRAAVAGVHGDALRVRVTAPPVGGAANRELLTFLAALLECPSGSVRLEAGARGHRKRVYVQGLGPAEARARVTAALSVDRTPGHN